jgi:hypothetical protein
MTINNNKSLALCYTFLKGAGTFVGTYKMRKETNQHEEVTRIRAFRLFTA